MDKTGRDKLEKIFSTYFKEIHKIYTDGNFREESFYPSFKGLIEECSRIFPTQAGINVLVLPRKTEAGIPDFRIGKNGEIIGYIEAKPPDTDLREVEESEQLKRYQDSLPNLILTNFLEFKLYRHGDPIDKVEVGRKFILQSLKFPPVPEKIDLFYEFLEKFFSFSTPQIQKSSDLSIELAKRTRFLTHILQEEISKGNEEVTRFYKAFQEELIETLTKERFADLYAQTITYGLFAARMRVQNGFKKELAWQFIPESLPLLREIFYSFTGPNLPESVAWIVDDITQVLEKANIPEVLKEFKTFKWDEDPVIHFYETFLATYNPKERKGLGVYYTPLPVVSYIVSSIHKLLKNRLKKIEGLATNDVTLLDPAAGTLTFVVQAIKQVQRELEDKKKEGLIKSYIEEHILPHFHAFEILVAPYTVGHFKVSMILEEMGYQFKKDKRFQFYLTNTLEMKEPKQISFLIDLAKEGQEAKKIKGKVPILAILGNPPYAVSSENKSEFIENLMEDYKEDVRDEQNIQPLSDDYIKFIRFAHWKISQAGKGILGFITNNSYLSGVIHRGMRQKLIETFDEIFILNLHGSSRIGEKTPEGERDENVFDIQQGVAIALYVKLEKPLKNKKVYYANLWGKREEKYKYLFGNDAQSTKWQELKPIAPYHFFVPKDFALQSKYEKFFKITDVFKEWSSGVKTHRDHFLVGFTKEEIKQKMHIFTGNLPDDFVTQSLNLKDTRDWKIKTARQNLKEIDWKEYIRLYSYRPFDNRYICYLPNLIDRGCDRWDLMKNFFNENIGIMTTRQLSSERFCHALVSNNVSDMCFVSNKGKETGYFFPLYLYKEKDKKRFLRSQLMLFEPEADYGNKKTNLSPGIVEELTKGFKKAPTPEQVFYYIYAVLYSNTYRKKYAEFLKIDFPRIPFPSNYETFKRLNELGKELVEVHLLKQPSLNKTGIGFSVIGSNKVEKVVYDKKTKRICINKEQYFEDVSNDVWEYFIGGYQVMDKYLKDRKGRKELSMEEINHYIKIAKAIHLTIEIQEKIDHLYRKIEI